MIRVERPTVEPNVRTKTVQLDKALRGIVAALAQTLQRPGEELRAIAVVRLDMIANFGRHDLADV
jgi:hypothetical protein